MNVCDIQRSASLFSASISYPNSLVAQFQLHALRLPLSLSDGTGINSSNTPGFAIQGWQRC
eukprot:4243220-Amphidinium_carterae.1